MFLKSDGILVKFPLLQGNVGKIFVIDGESEIFSRISEIGIKAIFECN